MGGPCDMTLGEAIVQEWGGQERNKNKATQGLGSRLRLGCLRTRLSPRTAALTYELRNSAPKKCTVPVR